MDVTATHSPISRGSLWFGLLGGALIWTIHFMLAFGIAEFGCVSGLGQRWYGGVSVVAWLELAITVAAFSIAIAATAVAYRNQVRLTSPAPNPGSIAEIHEYTARAGFYTSAIFSFVILFESIPIFFYLRHC